MRRRKLAAGEETQTHLNRGWLHSAQASAEGRSNPRLGGAPRIGGPDQGRRRAIFLTLLALAALLSASMLAPAFGAPKAVTAVSLAKKLTRTTKIAKRADRNAKRAIAGLQHVSGGGTGGTGATGPRGPKGDKGDPGTAANKGDPGPPGTPGAKGDKGGQGIQGIQGPPGFASTFITTTTFSTNGGSFNTGIADCPDSLPHAVAGGYDVSDSIGNLFNVMQNRPVGHGSGWLVRMRSGAQNPFTPEVWAVCVK
jgi:hypothetical protein